ncbi:UNVERIFIED_CONTAM: hypothetical protein K2H54_009672 [Gekko kuhli]
MNETILLQYFIEELDANCSLLDALQDGFDGPYCNSTTDQIGTCWPRTGAGELVERPCPEFFNGIKYNTTTLPEIWNVKVNLNTNGYGEGKRLRHFGKNLSPTVISFRGTEPQNGKPAPVPSRLCADKDTDAGNKPLVLQRDFSRSLCPAEEASGGRSRILRRCSVEPASSRDAQYYTSILKKTSQNVLRGVREIGQLGKMTQLFDMQILMLSLQ